jgi:DNA-binding MarR family transcriptional regulator
MVEQDKNNQLLEEVEILSQLIHELHHLSPSGYLDIELTESQCIVGVFVKKRGSCSMSEIATELRVSLSAITGIIDRMVKHGYVERLRDDSDRRLVIVQLTEKGLQVLDRSQQHIQYQLRTILEVLNEEDRAVFLGFIQKIIDALQQQKNQGK